MCAMRVGASTAAAALIGIAVCQAGSGESFHSGGVGHCQGCHISTENGARRGISTDICLHCHATQNGNTWGSSLLAPGPVYGGGSFIFLTEDNLNDGPGGNRPENWISGNHAGHNVVSLERGLLPDPDHATAPGGTYPASHLTCVSCHDPHGKSGNFRMLYGSGSPESRSDGHTFRFTVAPPVAEGIPLAGAPESRAHHTAYRSGWTEWCGQCHGRFHAEAESAFRHPVRALLGTEHRSTYDRYDGTGYETSGAPNRSYVPEVPYQSRDAATKRRGPTPGDAEVTCVTCHRAHASSAPYAGRWDFRIESWESEGVISGSHPIVNPYDDTAGRSQRGLCGKCHAAAGTD